ncbi:cell division protein FtsZ [Alloprevotella tannerae]|uniref:Cell division protein FtsZ n=1 Tax=Alloprevotella tannerae ATCC 51259 TaxID=626522 RepID=C9LIT4_9BACT|nr:cell division protein FtsZ [Alloprevotella tannerae]EEX70901.1 putative cell division protein FtsZ [Alloprevotella tannerae ATCC 51259]
MNDELLIEPVDCTRSSIIKVIGVGGGGGNAVANMYCEGLHDVRFLVCNTDRKALESSAVPDRLQLGPGLGAGGDPETGRALAEGDLEAIDDIFDEDTKMVFITAGMGGGTGTGASPIIAREAKSRGLLTVAIVTIPFLFELQRQVDKALDGVERLAKEVDAILVINNERLREIYPDLTVINAFKKADETLTKAVGSIVEIIKMRGRVNLDFRDVNMVLHQGGLAVISSGHATGPQRVTRAIRDALYSPLLNNKDIFRATRIAMAITCSSEPDQALLIDEMSEIEHFTTRFDGNPYFKWGFVPDAAMGDEIKVTILASGFGVFNEKSDQTDALSEDERTKRAIRRERIYGSGKRQKRPHAFIIRLQLEDMINGDLPELFESVPTRNRTPEMARQIRQALEAGRRKAPQSTESDAAKEEETPLIINFD